MDNKQKPPTFTCPSVWHFVQSVVLFLGWPLYAVQLLQELHAKHSPPALELLAGKERLRQPPGAQALHMVMLHIHFPLLLPFLVHFPSPLSG